MCVYLTRLVLILALKPPDDIPYYLYNTNIANVYDYTYMIYSAWWYYKFILVVNQTQFRSAST